MSFKGLGGRLRSKTHLLTRDRPRKGAAHSWHDVGPAGARRLDCKHERAQKNIVRGEKTLAPQDVLVLR